MMMKLTGISQITLRVNDLRLAEDFYAGTLGLKIDHRVGANITYLRLNSDMLVLVKAETPGALKQGISGSTISVSDLLPTAKSMKLPSISMTVGSILSLILRTDAKAGHFSLWIPTAILSSSTPCVPPGYRKTRQALMMHLHQCLLPEAGRK